MSDLIPPHGGLSEPVDRTVLAGRVAEFAMQAASLKNVPVSDADLSSLYRFGDGGLRSLTGPMDNATFSKVLDCEKIRRGGKHNAWTLPINFSAAKRLA